MYTVSRDGTARDSTGRIVQANPVLVRDAQDGRPEIWQAPGTEHWQNPTAAPGTQAAAIAAAQAERARTQAEQQAALNRRNEMGGSGTRSRNQSPRRAN